MKRIWRLWTLLICLAVALSACGSKRPSPPTWQEQYDLGVRYLSEGNYQEAIIAFTAAIEIDPKQASAYVGRGDAYINSGEREENLAAALADYETAIELDETLIDAYLKLSDICAGKNDYDRALELLQRGMNKTSSSLIEAQYIKILSETDRFVADEKFVPFSNMDPALQDLIETAMAGISEDPEGTAKFIVDNYVDLMLQETDPKWQLRTMRAGYKIQIQYLNPHEEGSHYADFEMRPRDGIAYYCHGDYFTGQLEIEHGWGTCENWNWNGAFEMKSTSDHHNHAGGTGIVSSGNCVDGLLDGSIYKPTSMWNSQMGYIPRYEYYDHGKIGKIFFEDGSEDYEGEKRNNELYSDEDLFYYAGLADDEWYEYWLLW